MTRKRELVGAGVCVIAMAVFVTWPQALHVGSQYAAHQDPEFSIWRLAWVAHALAHDPRHLFAANIFYPSPNPLAYSDAMLLQGVLAAPLFWLGLSPILIYNLMLIGGIAGSGLAMFLLARELTGSRTAAIFGAAVFTMAPYRIEHIVHLELQWAMWIPLTFWALHLTLKQTPHTVRYGLLTGLFIWLQVASCVYYGVFLAIALAAYVTVEAGMNWRRVMAALPALLAGAALASVLTAPYLLVYLGTAKHMGPRDMAEIATYSGRYWSYFAAPPQNWLRGSTAGPSELNLFLGWNAMALAAAGLLLPRQAPERIVYGVVAAISVALSLGLNTPLYGWLVRAVPTFQGLRSPSRFSIIVCFAVSVLAAFGAQAVRARLRSSGSTRAWIVLPLLFAFMLAEYANSSLVLVNRLRDGSGTVYKAIQSSGPGVVVELPMPHAGALPGADSVYELWSLSHWHPLVNGYSGYYPPEYIETLARMETFPDDDSVSRLQRLQVRYLVVHCAFYEANDPQDGCSPSMLIKIGGRKEIRPFGKFTDPLGGPTYLFALEP